MRQNREFLHQLMSLAWQFAHQNGFGKSQALKAAWVNLRLKNELQRRIVRFYFRKSDGNVREAWGTLCNKYMPAQPATRKKAPNNTVQCYWDTERGEFRSYKKANLIGIA